MTETDFLQIKAILLQASISELRKVMEFTSGVWDSKIRLRALDFEVGDPVQWNGKRGLMTGVITKVNKKNADCSTSQGPWKVGLSLLEHNKPE